MNKRKTGSEYENRAEAYLIEKGYRILERNFRTSYGEIDRIAERDNVLVFCEIKYRTSNAYGDPLEAVDLKKQRRISRVAWYYYAGNGYLQQKPCRFDVIAIYGDGSVRHIENAFEFQ